MRAFPCRGAGPPKHGITRQHSDLFGKGGREFLARLELRDAPRRRLDSLMSLIEQPWASPARSPRTLAGFALHLRLSRAGHILSALVDCPGPAAQPSHRTYTSERARFAFQAGISQRTDHVPGLTRSTRLDPGPRDTCFRMAKGESGRPTGARRDA